MNLDLALTFLELGHATSRNLEFSHQKSVWVSYGEETITETNLLEIRRRHSLRIRLHTFNRHEEAKNGADWEWRIVGQRRTLKMRVQAKRVQSDGILKIAHQVKSSKMQQRKLLIDGARKDSMKPVYCIYSTECRRKKWKEARFGNGSRGFQAGCLLADAEDVPLATRRLADIEEKCKPWHFLFLPQRFWSHEFESLDDHTATAEYWGEIGFLFEGPVRGLRAGRMGESLDTSGWHCPTIFDLNHDTRRRIDWTGVDRTTPEDLAWVEPDAEAARDIHESREKRLKEQGVRLIMAMDVRGYMEHEEERE